MNIVIVVFFSKCTWGLHVDKVRLILIDYSDVCTLRQICVWPTSSFSKVTKQKRDKYI